MFLTPRPFRKFECSRGVHAESWVIFFWKNRRIKFVFSVSPRIALPPTNKRKCSSRFVFPFPHLTARATSSGGPRSRGPPPSGPAHGRRRPRSRSRSPGSTATAASRPRTGTRVRTGRPSVTTDGPPSRQPPVPSSCSGPSPKPPKPLCLVDKSRLPNLPNPSAPLINPGSAAGLGALRSRSTRNTNDFVSPPEIITTISAFDTERRKNALVR